MQGQQVLGYVTRDKLQHVLAEHLATKPPHQACTFIAKSVTDDVLDLSTLLDASVLQLRKEMPQELIVSMFQKLVSAASLSQGGYSDVVMQNLRHVIFTNSGVLEGMVTKTDIVAFLNRQFPHTAELSNDPQHIPNGNSM